MTRSNANAAAQDIIKKFGLFKEAGSMYNEVANKLFNLKVDWEKSGDPLNPYQADVKGAHWALRVNDFPEEEMYTLLIDNRPTLSFTEPPAGWTLPGKTVSPAR